jgi:arylsulfatase A-like enzyme/Flp pilus assembly protein TadD
MSRRAGTTAPAGGERAGSAALTTSAAVLLSIVLSACGGQPPFNLVMITLDTTRADRLGCYGRERAGTRNLDRLAAEGSLFLECYSSAPVTTPSHSTMFTGLYPLAHGVRDNGMFVLPDRMTTLAELMRDAGFATGAAVGAFPVTREFGLHQGFDYFNDHITITDEDFQGQRAVPSRGVFFDERPAPWVNEAIFPWLDEHVDRPFFMWLHYWDAHHPLVPPEPFSEIYSADLYQGEIAFVDQSFGVLVRKLKEAGVYERTVVIVVGDHGEGLGEHDEETHSLLTYNSTIRVPLIIRIPGSDGGRRIRQRVGTVDILPTVAEIFDLHLPDGVQGRSLAAALAGPDELERYPTRYYAETLSPRLSHGWGEVRTLWEGPYKYIHGPRPELYHIEDDPDELNDLVAELPETSERLEAELVKFIERHADDTSADAAATPDGETLDRLAALGYISAGAEGAASIREELRTDGEAPQDRVGDNSLMSSVKQQIHRGNFLAAKESALRLVERDPDNAYYSGMLAMAFMGLGQMDEAARIVEQFQDILPQNEPILNKVIIQLFNAGERERALALGRTVVDRQPSAQAHYMLAEMYAVMGETGPYREHLEAALDLDDGYSRARLSLAILLATSGDAAAAEVEFVRLVTDYPLNPRYRFNRGVFLGQAGRLEEARADLERAVQLSPAYWKAQLALLAVHIERSDRPGAETVRDAIRRGCGDRAIVDRAETMMELL